MNEAPSTSRTILFADIVGSTRLYDRLGDTVARGLVAVSFEVMRTVVETNHGRVIKTIGDGVMSCFDLPSEAARAAISMYETTAIDGRLVPENLRLRIGFHHGSFIEADNDLYGDAVNIAARMAAQAKAGQIITSRQTLDLFSRDLQSISRMVDTIRVRGKADPIEIFELAWGQPGELTVTGSVTGELVSSTMERHALMTLDMQDQHISVNHEYPLVNLGRDRTNRLVVDSPRVSRLHARVEMRRDRFVLIDQSTNGTYVYPKQSGTRLLRRDELTLDGEGFFSLGQGTGPDSHMAIHYICL